jgi:hypothetical protein
MIAKPFGNDLYNDRNENEAPSLFETFYDHGRIRENCVTLRVTLDFRELRRRATARHTVPLAHPIASTTQRTTTALYEFQ